MAIFLKFISVNIRWSNPVLAFYPVFILFSNFLSFSLWKLVLLASDYFHQKVFKFLLHVAAAVVVVSSCMNLFIIFLSLCSSSTVFKTFQLVWGRKFSTFLVWYMGRIYIMEDGGGLRWWFQKCNLVMNKIKIRDIWDLGIENTA